MSITGKNHTKDVYLISNPGAQLSGEAGVVVYAARILILMEGLCFMAFDS
jgi:hypothetical protein